MLHLKMDIQSQRNVIASYYLTKNNLPYDIIQYIMSLVINYNSGHNLQLNLPLNKERLVNYENKCFIIDDKWIQMYGSPYDLLSNIMPLSEYFNVKNKDNEEYAISFTKRRNGTIRPRLSKYVMGDSIKNVFFRPSSKPKNETDVLLFFKYQTNDISLPIFLFSMWIDVKQNHPINEALFDKEIRMRCFQTGKKIHMYEHIRFDSNWVEKIKNTKEYFVENICTGDIIILSYADNLSTDVPDKHR